MRTINSRKDLSIGTRVEVILEYSLGTISIGVGEIGVVVGFRLMDLPDLLLWDIKVWDIDFDGKVISAAEEVVRYHMRIL